MKKLFSILLAVSIITSAAKADSYEDKALRIIELGNTIEPTIKAMRDMFPKLVPQLKGQIKAALSASGKPISDARAAEITNEYGERLIKEIEVKMIPLTINEMRQHFTETELADLIEVMETPAYQAYANKLPDFMSTLTKNSMNLGQRTGMEVMMKLISEEITK